MKKYKVKNRSSLFSLKKKWLKNGIEKCKIVDETGYEYIVTADQLKEVKKKSNKNKNK